jgi:hypothetical protein
MSRFPFILQPLLAVELLNAKLQATTEGLQKIINIRATMNKGLSVALNKAFPNTITSPRPLVIFRLCPSCLRLSPSRGVRPKARQLRSRGSIKVLPELPQHGRGIRSWQPSD